LEIFLCGNKCALSPCLYEGLKKPEMQETNIFWSKTT